MTRAFLIGALALLTACTSPRARCEADATRDLRVVRGLILQAERNLERGYAVDSREVTRDRRRLCEDDDGTRRFCTVTETRSVQVPRSIDLDAELDKLHQLRQTETRLNRRAERDIASCAALPDQ